MSYQQKYLKYKQKYLELKKSLGGMPGGPRESPGPMPVSHAGPKAWGLPAGTTVSKAELAEAAATSAQAQDLSGDSLSERRKIINENGLKFEAELRNSQERTLDTAARLAANPSAINRQLDDLAKHDVAVAHEILRAAIEAHEYYGHKSYGMDVLSKEGPPYKKAVTMPALLKIQIATATESTELKKVKINKAKIQVKLNTTVSHFDATSRAVAALQAQRVPLATQHAIVRAIVEQPRLNRAEILPTGLNRWGDGRPGNRAFGDAVEQRAANIATNQPILGQLTQQLTQLDRQLAAARAELATVQPKLEALLEHMHDLQVAENYFIGRLKNRDDPANVEHRAPLQALTPIQRERALTDEP